MIACWASVSTPSTTVCMPSLRASEQTVSTMAREAEFVSSVCTKPRSTFTCENGNDDR